MKNINSNFFRIILSALFACPAFSASAAYLSRPELVDYNFSGASVCEKNPLKIKFDHENFNGGNVFTVEIAANGNFNGSSIITLSGSLTQAGNSQNVFLTVNFPVSVPAGNNYRLRIRGSNPLTYSSQLNEFPFSVSKIPIADPAFSPENYWRGYFYTWTPSTSNPIPDGNAEDIFNPARFIGYISEASNSFDFNWGNTISAPAALPDTNKVCGTYRDFFAIRMKRRFQLESGYYLFSGGADDGFRFSVDGGQSWLLNDWSDHQFREVSFNGSNGCGIFLNQGTYDFVVEYYENKIDSRFKFSMSKAPSAADFTGLQTSYCINSPTSTLFPLASGQQGTFSGPGVSGNIFNPQVAGPGRHTITYFLNGPSGSCGDTIRKIADVFALPDAGFSGLPGQICEGAGAQNLLPNVAGGSFSGSGISGTSFSPDGLAAGSSYLITYRINANGCQNESSQPVFVQAIPNADFSGLPDSIGSDAGPVNLNPSLAGGVFSGPGVQGTSFFSNQVSAPGTFEIVYAISSGGCSNTSSRQVFVFPVLPEPFLIPNLVTGNRDGRNDNWTVSGIPGDAEIRIFSRWGKEVFSGLAKEGWNPGSDLVPGYYFYQVLLSDGSKSWTGWIQLIAEME